MDRKGLERLAREARAIGRLEHPHVVKVFDVSIEPPDPHIVMEYVEGKTLRDWQKGRPWDEVVAVYVQAGSGLAAAHEAGIVHRDFKPHNVMVGPSGRGRWRARVLDFGLAREGASGEASVQVPGLVHDSSDVAVTETGAVVGTLAYMAPEQCVGEAVGPGADQFAFCVALWEALFGKRPFEASSIVGLHDAITKGEPDAGGEPAAIPERVRSVLRRGLQSSVEQRYPDMPALLTDLRRAVGRRSLAWWLLAGCVPVIAALVLPSGDETPPCRDGAVTQAWSPDAAEQIVSAFEASSRPFASTAATHAVQTLERYADEWSRVYEQTCRDVADAEGADARRLDLRMACLHRWEAQLQATVERLAAGGESVDRASDILAGLPMPGRCADLEGDEETSPQIERARALIAAAHADRAAYRLEEAERNLARAREEAGSEGNERITAELAVEAGLIAAARGDWATSETELEEALRIATARQFRDLVVDAAVGLIHTVGEGQRRLEEGMEYGEIAEKFVDDDRLRRAEIHDELGILRLRQGKPAEAEADFRAAIALRDDELPEEEAWRVTDARGNLAIALAQQGKLEEAIERMREVLEIEQATKGPDHVDTLMSLHNLGLALSRTGAFAEGEAEVAKAIELGEASGAPAPLLYDWRENRALMLDFVERYEEGEALARDVYEYRVEQYGSSHARTAKAAILVTQILVDKGDLDAAVPWAERAWLSIGTAEGRPDLRAYAAYLVATLLHDTKAKGTVDRQRALLEEARVFYAANPAEHEERLSNVETYLERIDAQASSKPSSDAPSDSSK